MLQVFLGEVASSPWEGRKHGIRSQGYFRENPSFWKLEKLGSNALVFVLHFASNSKKDNNEIDKYPFKWPIQINLSYSLQQGRSSLKAQMVKNLPAMKETLLNSWVENIPGEGNGYSLLYICLENSVDRGASWAIVRGVTKSQKRLKDLAAAAAFHSFIQSFRHSVN